jgi:hypothetical protein
MNPLRDLYPVFRDPCFLFSFTQCLVSSVQCLVSSAVDGTEYHTWC